MDIGIVGGVHILKSPANALENQIESEEINERNGKAFDTINMEGRAVAEWVRGLVALTGDQTVPGRVRIPLLYIFRFGTLVAIPWPRFASVFHRRH